MSDYMSYYSTGHRNDKEHSKRLDNCTVLAAAYWLFEEQKYLETEDSLGSLGELFKDKFKNLQK